jgi:predicted Fe-Mo cluster-binding NifX family protein
MKIAVAHWQNRISPVFDVSGGIYLIDIEDGKEVKRESRILTIRDPLSRAREVSALGVGVLICGAVSSAYEEALIGAGIKVMGFICGDVDTIVSAFLCGQLSNGCFFMPGCYNNQRRRHFRGSRRRL